MKELSVPRPLILVVEDDANLRELLLESLRDAGFQTASAESGRTALEQIQACRPDLVLSDVMMAEGTGHDLLRAIRSDRSLADLPVIFLSALSRGADVRVGMNLGADDYLPKPFSLSDLHRSVEARLERMHRFPRERGGGAAAVASPPPATRCWPVLPASVPDLLPGGCHRSDAGRAREAAQAVSEAAMRGSDLLLTVRSGWVHCPADVFDAAVEAVLAYSFRHSRAGDPVWCVGGWSGDRYQLTAWCRAWLPGTGAVMAVRNATESAEAGWPSHLPDDPALRWAGSRLRQTGGELRVEDCGADGVRIHAEFPAASPLP